MNFERPFQKVRTLIKEFLRIYIMKIKHTLKITYQTQRSIQQCTAVFGVGTNYEVETQLLINHGNLLVELTFQTVYFHFKLDFLATINDVPRNIVRLCIVQNLTKRELVQRLKFQKATFRVTVGPITN